MTQKAKFFIIIFCCLYGCKKPSKLMRIEENIIGNEEFVISVSPNELDLAPFDLTPFIDSIKYVKLELTDESLIGSIDKIVIFEELIYILDIQTKSLFVFNMDGKFSHKISKIGQGPGEYIQLDFFDIDRENKHIVLTDLMSYWVMRYDMNGEFLFRRKIPVWCEGLSILPNKGIVLYSNFRNNTDNLLQEYNLIYLDSNMNFKRGYFPYNSKEFNQRIRVAASMGGQFFAYEENLYFTFPGGSTVYQVEEDSLIIKYKFDFGKDMREIENQIKSDKLAEQLDKRYNGFWSYVMENDKLLFFTMVSVPVPLLNALYYSKESGKQLFSIFYFVEDKIQIDFPQTGYKSWIIYDIQPFEIIKWKERFPKDNIPSAGRYTKARLDLAEELTDEDNPVLMFLKFKDF